MNKKFLLTLIIAMLVLAACASNTPTTASSSKSKSSANALTPQTQLILGTLKLEEAEHAITSEQAAELLPMWHVLKELSSSNAAAQDEIDGLVSQIEATLTSDQTTAINNMELGMQDMMTVMQQSGGIASGGTNPSQTGSTVGAAGGGAGGPPDIGGGMPGGPSEITGAAPSAGTISTSSNTNAFPVMDNGAPSALFDAVIELLQKKVAS